MGSHTKKKLIAALLIIACIACGALLIYVPATPVRVLQNSHQLDSLVTRTLEHHHISPQFVGRQNTAIDSSFTRTVYRISVPASYSQTRLHMALQQQLLPYNVAVPARVRVPENEMHIQLYFHHTVVGAVHLAADEDLPREPFNLSPADE